MYQLGQPVDAGHDLHGGIVEKLDGVGTRLVGRGDGIRHRLEIVEDQQNAGALRIERDRAQHDVGDETESALGADEQMSEDLQGVVEVDEGVDPVSGHALDRELLAYERDEPGVRPRLVAKPLEAPREFGPLAGEASLLTFCRGVPDGPVR